MTANRRVNCEYGFLTRRVVSYLVGHKRKVIPWCAPPRCEGGTHNLFVNSTKMSEATFSCNKSHDRKQTLTAR